jgi:hypothetical protein
MEVKEAIKRNTIIAFGNLKFIALTTVLFLAFILFVKVIDVFTNYLSFNIHDVLTFFLAPVFVIFVFVNLAKIFVDTIKMSEY